MKKNIDIQKLTFRVLGTVTDILLFYTYWVGASVGKTGSRGVYEAFSEAEKELQKCNHQTLANAWYKLVKTGLIQLNKRKGLFHPEITEMGKKLLSQRLPTYQKNRPWDHKVYLITYDIPETHHKKRDLFRYFLRRIHCRRFQESVWLTPYNPRQLINDYVSENKISGTIIVSDVGKDGGIGETTAPYLLGDLYSLENLNKRYKEFIQKVTNKFYSPAQTIFAYFSILKDDPQIPFELLPKDWFGEKAYILSEEVRKNYTLLNRGRESDRR